MENHNLALTKMETQALEYLIDSLYAEAGFSDVGDTCISKGTGIPMNQLRGVLASLSKKGIIYLEEGENYSWCSSVIYLEEKFWYLHPEWKDEA